jgi:Concanavalin A-like lectin/glucanases superfamily/Ricin-type beta-trefoil lectin domain-like
MKTPTAGFLLLNRIWRLCVVARLLAVIFPSPLRAQDHTILFSPTDPGVTRSITNWGLDTCWPSYDNMRRGLMFMGTNNVNLVRVGYVVDAPLTNNDLSASQKAALQTHANLANMATAATRWDLNMASNVDPWYQSGAGTVYPDRWAAAMQACQRYYNKSFWMVEGFNEPDYGWGQGSQQNLYDLFGYLQASTNFSGAALAGGSTLNNDVALAWFNAVSSRVTIGTTHCLAGSASTYVSFIQAVTASNAMPFNPELHNVMEAIMGVNYGLKGGIWWGTAERARGEFVKACQGKRLGYADDLAKWTAAAVYRGTNGIVQAFVGASERMATTTTYRFFSRDRDVFYDGHGPQREYTVTIPGGTGYATADQRNAEKVMNITWGADVPPPINGRYYVVNRNSGKLMEVAGGSTNSGANIQQNAYTGGTNQQWDVVPLASTNGGDYSYFSMTAVHSGKAADVNNFSFDNGGNVMQWDNVQGVNQQWFFEYAGNGYFYIRSRWSGLGLDVNNASTANGANIQQWTLLNGLNQQWRLIPVGEAVEFVAPAAPTGVIAAANPLSVELNWNVSGAADLAGYTVLRATNSGGPYEIVARGLTNNAFTDKSANQPRTYFYVVKAADKSLNLSANSAQVSATPTANPALLVRYTFDGNNNDNSGNANHPILINGSPNFVAGKYGSAIDLNGASQYAMAPAGLLASVTNFTIALWVNWDGGAAWQRIFDFGNDTTQYMFLTPGSGSGTLRFAITTNGGGAEQILQTSPLPVGQWQHVAVTRNGNTARLYTNGVVAASGTVTIAPASFNSALNFLGDSQYAADPLFNGRLDEFFIYNYALSDMEITRLMNNQPPPPVTPTTLSAVLVGNALNFSWPANYLGCRLQVQTNSLDLGLGTNWSDVAGSAATNTLTLPIDPNAGSVFYRLIYP